MKQLNSQNKFELLRKRIINNNLPRNLLFISSNKMLLQKKVLQLVAMLVCTNNYKWDDCNCRNHQLVTGHKYFDLIEIGDFKREILKNEIENIITKFSYSSVDKTNIKVYVVYGVNKFNPFSGNALLKFLEQQHDVYAFFLTDSINDVLPTIRSRCLNLKINFQSESNYNDDVGLKKVKLIINYLQGGDKIAFLNLIDEIKQTVVNEQINFIQCFSHYLKKHSLKKDFAKKVVIQILISNLILINNLENKVLVNKKIFWDVWTVRLERSFLKSNQCLMIWNM